VHEFPRKLITEWRRLGLPISGEPIIVAVSGGADSTALLLAMAELRRRKKFGQEMIAAHFNHKLRGVESDADETYVRYLASSLGVGFALGTGSLKGKSNLEERARNSRYVFLADIAVQYGSRLILTAHTINDQAETFLINLIRGSGPDGLAGMKPIRRLDREVVVKESGKFEISDIKSQIELVRPLLRWSKRSHTEEFCRENGVEFRTDSMNDDPAFTRVRVRKSVLPMLAEINPRIVETLARTAELLQFGSQSSASRMISHDETDSQKPAITMLLKELKPLESALLYAKLRSWLRSKRGNLRGLELKHIVAIERLIQSRKSGRVVELPAGETVIKQGGMLMWSKIKVEK